MFAGMLDLGIDIDVWPWIWIGTALVFALVELIFIGGTFILLPWAASAFISAILAFYDVSVEVQWAVFVFGGAGLFVLLYRWARKFVNSAPATPGVGAERLRPRRRAADRALSGDHPGAQYSARPCLHGFDGCACWIRGERCQPQ